MDGGGVIEFMLFIYLIGGLSGGEMVFYERWKVVVEVVLVVGLVFFYIYGVCCLLYEVKFVFKGVKYVLCFDVVFVWGMNFDIMWIVLFLCKYLYFFLIRGLVVVYFYF